MKSYKSFVKEYSSALQVPATSYLKPIGDLISGKPLRKKESVKLKEVVHKYMTGHGLTLGGKKYDLTILSPKELTGKKVSVSSKFMERGAWTKTDTSKHNN